MCRIIVSQIVSLKRVDSTRAGGECISSRAGAERPCGKVKARMFLVCLIFFWIVALASVGQSETFYVAADGDDASTGTVDHPWRTIQRAANAMVAGDATIIGPGTYLENVISRASGTAEAPIMFKAGSTETIVSSFSIAHPHHVIEGFTITGANVSQYQGAVTIRRGGDSLRVKNNIFKSSPDRVYQLLVSRQEIIGLSATENQFLNGRFHAISLVGTGHSVSASVFRNPNGWDAIRLLSSNTIISGNTFENWSNLTDNQNHPDLIQAFSNNGEVSKNNIIEKNFARDCVATQIGNVQDQRGDNVGNWIWRNNIWANVEYAMAILAPGMEFYNNVFYKSGRNTSGPLNFNTIEGRGRADDAKVFNNVFVECGSRPNDPRYGWYTVNPELKGFEADCNLVIGTGDGMKKSGFQMGTHEASGLNGLSPQFQNAEVLDFRLTAQSPCVGAGRAFNHLFDTDISGSMRGGKWDIGAYQLPPPDAPRNLRVTVP